MTEEEKIEVREAAKKVRESARTSRRMRRFYWIRKNITMPLANWLINANKQFSITVERDGNYYEATFHRLQYFYDKERITIRGILERRKTWCVTYWDKFDHPDKFGGCEISWSFKPFVYADMNHVYGEVGKALNGAIDNSINTRKIGENA